MAECRGAKTPVHPTAVSGPGSVGPARGSIEDLCSSLLFRNSKELNDTKIQPKLPKSCPVVPSPNS